MGASIHRLLELALLLPYFGLGLALLVFLAVLAGSRKGSR